MKRKFKLELTEPRYYVPINIYPTTWIVYVTTNVPDIQIMAKTFAVKPTKKQLRKLKKSMYIKIENEFFK